MMSMAQWKYPLAAAPMRMLDALALSPRPARPVAYVVERANWSTKWDGTYICQAVERIALNIAEVIDRPQFLARRIVHFGSQFQWVTWAKALPRSNRFAVTYFHGKPEDDDEMARHVDIFMTLAPRAERIVTAASLVEARLLAWGIPRDKLVRIPIGVDLDLFPVVSPEERRAARARYGIGQDRLVVGCFQKDGNGWGEGNEPKLLKGPDVFLDVIAEVAKVRPLFVLLTGPARGFVKRGLDKIGVPYAHDFVDDYRDLPSRFAALDVYLNPSREEGGPKGIIEAMASGVPVVTTRVGMAPDLVRNGESGFIAESEDVAALVRAILDIGARPEAMQRLTEAARAAVLACNWDSVGRRHYEEVWRPMMVA
jgi:glycosyltransferase involved in cell wall biosynthesis